MFWDLDCPGIQTWRQSNIAETRKVNKEVMAIYMSMLGCDKPGCDYVTDNAIILRLKLCLLCRSLSIFAFIYLFVL